MNNPTIKQARTICDALKARGVIVIAFSGDNFAGASYGETRGECKQIGHALDQIVNAINAGKISVWAERAEERG